ncbi:junction-mediating and -regulatory protein-like isoform X2 [Syngnathoides biaculeatus]|uniref:junction-mediating and -regulatory protein-like isoform X2 n=1 Tax=Syngnathoides biaculeatus TaxID=300417 RepID=UPI002ADE2DD4|nr:junction-mediating and -regulatory protein-like isoform X2 [Syngnathoides biaculeatus]
MSFTMEDHLESGWVAVRPNAFEEKEKHKIVFIVAWNEVEGKFAITCHNRTAQRRSFGSSSSSSSSGGGGGGGTDAPSEDGDKTRWPESDKASRSPGPGAREAAVKGLKGKLPGSKLSPVKIKTVLNYVSSHVSCDGEPQKEEQLPSVDTLDLEDGLSPEDCSWAGLFSFQDLRAVHQQLCSVNSDLEPCLPVFPEEPSGMWTVLFGPAEVSEAEMDELCSGLQLYLGHALDVCGWKILSRLLFAENDDPDEYYESLSELRRCGYEEALSRESKHLQELLDRHKSLDSMVDLLELYEEEDQAYGSLLEASTQLYQYLLQPFRDMRELAMLRRQQIKISMENDYLGPRRVFALQQEDSDWQRKAQEAVLIIQEFTVKYFETTARAQKGVYERMKVDQRKFGKASWTAAVERMERIRYAVAKETLQLQRAREISLEQRKRTLREEMQSLCRSEDALTLLDRMESQYYELQLQLYDIQAEILQCEELLLAAQLDRVRRQMAEHHNEVVYYDTFESADEITQEDTAEKEELDRLQVSARRLEARRGRIVAKRSYLRSKREICVSNHVTKQQMRSTTQKDSLSQWVLQTKFDEEEDERKNSRVRQERQRTLDRLRTFKQRYPGQVILKSARLRAAHGRRRDRGRIAQTGDEGEREGRSQPAGARDPGQRPLFLSISVQTDASSALTAQPVAGLAARSLPPLPVPGPADSFCSPCSLSSLLASPTSPPPPPPPLPLPPIREQVSPSESPGGPSRRPGGGSASEELSRSSLGPFHPRFFDSSQLVSARKKLRKTPGFEARSRRGSSPMDEVLASLKRGSFHLKKVDQRPVPPAAQSDDDPDSILAQIRKGVKLRQVPPQERKGQEDVAAPRDPLTQSIYEALRRIKEASPESDSDDDGPGGPDWES